MKLQSSLLTVGIVFVMLFGMAFECGSDNDETGGGATGERLPAGTYQCTTTVATYAGTGGGGGVSYPIYNFTLQVRSTIKILRNGTYQLGEDSVASKYSYDPATGKIRWDGDAHGMAADSSFDPEKKVIFIQMGNESWDCKPVE